MKNIRREKANDRIRLIIKDINTICPHRKTNREDSTNIEMVYTPGTYEINERELGKYIEENIEGKEIAMELIPLRILSHSIEDVTMRRSGNRYAAPKHAQIKSSSSGKKKWAMTIELNFYREISNSIP